MQMAEKFLQLKTNSW